MTRKKFTRITTDPKILAGKAIISGTRIAVNFLVDLLRNNWAKSHLLENYPSLEEEDILQAIDYSIEEYAKIINETLMKWGETSSDVFIEKARDGRLEDAENDAIVLRQCFLEQEFLLEKKAEFT